MDETMETCAALVPSFFFDKDALRREFRVSCFFHKGLRVRIVADASPWGLGALLIIQETILVAFSASERGKP